MVKYLNILCVIYYEDEEYYFVGFYSGDKKAYMWLSYATLIYMIEHSGYILLNSIYQNQALNLNEDTIISYKVSNIEDEYKEEYVTYKDASRIELYIQNKYNSFLPFIPNSEVIEENTLENLQKDNNYVSYISDNLESEENISIRLMDYTYRKSNTRFKDRGFMLFFLKYFITDDITLGLLKKGYFYKYFVVGTELMQENELYKYLFGVRRSKVELEKV